VHYEKGIHWATRFFTTTWEMA
jgi:hypothetical protein